MSPQTDDLHIAERALLDVAAWLGFRGPKAWQRYTEALGKERRAIFKRAKSHA